MHILQPKHSKLGEKEVKELFLKYNITMAQLPSIKIIDPALPPGCKINDIIKIERRAVEGKTFYYRVVVE